jgi:DNA replication protein DnaC
MEARILQWRDMAKERQVSAEAFEAMQQEIKQRDAEQAKQQRIDHSVKQIPMRFRGKILDDYTVEHEDQAYVKNVVERFIETASDRLAAGTSMCLMGKPGTGKTLLSLIMYQAIVQKGFNARYEPSLEFLKRLIEIKFKSNHKRTLIEKLND